MVILIFVLLNPDLSLYENTVDPDQFIELIAGVNIGIQWWISISNSIKQLKSQSLFYYTSFLCRIMKFQALQC